VHRRKKSRDRRRSADSASRELGATEIADRERALRQLAPRARGLPWSRRLILLLLDELGEVDDLEDLLGSVRRLPAQRYPEAVALAIALRYSWRRDQFRWIARRIRALANRSRTPPKMKRRARRRSPQYES
jgi:hypothetical protein